MIVEDYDSAYDFALLNGRHDLAQYLFVGPLLRQKAPANVLAIGGVPHAPLLMHAAFSAGNGGDGMKPLMVYLGDDERNLADAKDLLCDFGGIVHKIEYSEDQNRGVRGVDDLVMNTEWDMVVVDRAERSKLIQSLALPCGFRLARPEKVWVVVTGFENRDLRKATEALLGETEHVCQSFRRGAGGRPIWGIYPGEH
jgi:hypothetical protein